MRDVGIVGFAQSEHQRAITDLNEVEFMIPILVEVREQVGIDKDDIGFTCSGSTDFLAGQAFSFVGTLDGVGPVPPISESHVEMDGAFALYEAWVKLQIGEVDTALVYGYGKSSPGDLPKVMATQLDPYYVAPLWPDSFHVAALQARLMLESGAATERDFAEVAARTRRQAMDNPKAQIARDDDVDALLEQPYLADPLRRHDCPPISDGGAAVILAAEDAAWGLSDRPAWIRGIDHRVDAHGLGVRDLTRSDSTRLAGEKAGVAGGPVDIAELHAPFSHQELILRRELGLADDVTVNPSGGALAANPMMAAGLIRLGEAAQRITRGDADRAVAHATSGPCLQQNLVAVLEGD